jgi:RNA methyltransferase, TrmH family
MSDETQVGFRQIEFTPVQSKIKKLQTDRHYRNGKGLFYAEGIRNFVEAVDNDYSIDTIIYSEKLLVSPIARKMVRQLKRDGTAFARVTPEQFRAVSVTERASGIAAIYRRQFHKLEQLKFADNICWTALSEIRSAGNLGTLFRTSAAVGGGGFILIGDAIDPFEPSVVRASMGAIFRQKIIRANLKQFQNWVKTNKLQVVGASPDGAVDYHKAVYQSPTILMLGNERSGLTETEKQACGQTVRIPMTGGTDSLNVAVAGSLLLYEVFRASQRV